MKDHEDTKNMSPINFDKIKVRLRDRPRRRGKSLIELIAEKYGVSSGVGDDVGEVRSAELYGTRNRSSSKYQAKTLANDEQ